jgi:Fe-Mn family superoxide dismutase
MKHTLPPLNYAYDALEPYIDAKTMELHHTKHHQAYIDKLNAALEKYPDLQGRPVEELLMDLANLKVEEMDRTAIRNHGGGHLNHSMFWKYLDPANTKDELLAKELTGTFGSVDEFKKQFTESATKLFGSGWTWLVRDNKDSKIRIQNLPMQDSPVMVGLQPIFGLDVWEHAYYLKYQNKRPDYIAAWWNVLKLI